MLQKLFHNHKIFLTVIISVIIFVLLIISSPFTQVLDKNLHDIYSVINEKISPAPVSKQLYVVTIGPRTEAEFGKFPFSREVYAKFIKKIEKFEPGVVGFDILFIAEQDEKKDSILKESLVKAGNIVLGSGINNSVHEVPLESFRDAASYGPVVITANPYNRGAYSFRPFFTFDGEQFKHFDLQLLEKFYNNLYNTTEISFSDKGSYIEFREGVTNNIRIPYSKKGKKEILFSYVPTSRIQKLEFLDLYEGKYDDIDLGDSPIFLVGTTLDGVDSNFFTPYGNEYGLFIHANIINTFLTKNFLIYFSNNSELLLVFLVTIICIYMNLYLRSWYLWISNIVLGVIFIIILPLALYYVGIVINYPVEIAMSILLSLIFTNGLKYIGESSNKDKLKKSLSEYVGEKIAQEVLDGAGNINFEGDEKKAILFFSDIEGFTTISEKLTPQELIIFLKEYLREMSDILLDSKGYINKYEGDAIMGLWGIFSPLREIQYSDVCEVSLLQMKRLEELSDRWKDKYGFEVKIRIGIHSGMVIIGNIGAEGRKMEFTALGDTVNLASRLEGVNKFYGTNICVSQDIYEVAKDRYEFRMLDKIQVVGKTEAISIYELMGRKGELSEQQEKIRTLYHYALELYFQRKFDRAKVFFTKLAEKGDAPSLTFKSRITIYQMSPPEDDWDGVWIMHEK